MRRRRAIEEKQREAAVNYTDVEVGQEEPTVAPQEEKETATLEPREEEAERGEEEEEGVVIVTPVDRSPVLHTVKDTSPISGRLGRRGGREEPQQKLAEIAA